MLPEVARQGLAEFCDVFCETGVFSVAESRRILTRARDLGLRLKLHADELTPLGGAELAAEVGAVSADHLLCVTEAGIDALAASGTVATLLPGTAFFLGVDYAPARRLIERGVAVALASDCNPGTCPTENLPLVGTMACTQMGMLPGEVVTALTLNAAAALGRGDRLGSLTPGKQADVLICDVSDYRDTLLSLRNQSCRARHQARPRGTPGLSRSRRRTSIAPAGRSAVGRMRRRSGARDAAAVDRGVRFWSDFRKMKACAAIRAGREPRTRPSAIRHWLYRLTSWDAARGADLAALDLLDVGERAHRRRPGGEPAGAGRGDRGRF